MGRGSYINIRYLTEFVDEGTKPMLASDRQIRAAVASTNKVLVDQGAVAGDVAAEQTKLATETARVATTQVDMGASAGRAAVEEARLGTVTSETAVAAGRAAKANAQLAAAYAREAAEGVRVTGTTRQVAGAQATAAAAATRSAGAHDAAAAAATRSANRFTAAGAAMSAHGKGTKEAGRALDGMLIPMALVAAGSGKLSVDYGRAMEQIHTQAGATQAEVDKLKGSVLGMAGHDVSQSPQHLAEGLYHLESVGLRGAKAMGALKVAAEGAAVGNTDVESTAAALGSAWLVNIKGAGNLRHVMAELNATVGAGNVRMSDLVDALGTGILPASKEAGLSLHDVMGALAVFTDEGYQASSAAAQFSTALHFLYNPTQKAGGAFRAMGLQTDSLAKDLHKPQGLLVALRDLKAHLEEAGKHSGKELALSPQTSLPATDPATRQEQLLGAILPGGRGRIMLTLLNQLDRYQMKLGQIQRTTSQFGEDLTKTHETAAYRLQRSWSQIEGDAIHFGDVLVPAILPPIEHIAHGVGDAAEEFGNLPESTRTAIVGITLAGAALGPFLKIYGNLAQAGGFVVSSLGKVRTALFGYTAAQKAAALATTETATAEAAQGEASAAGGLTGALGRRGGLLGMVGRGVGRYGTAVAGTQIAETQAVYAMARGTGASVLGGGVAALRPAAGVALRMVGWAALGASLVDGIVHGIESKRSDFGGKFQDFLHGATFGIVHAAGEELQHRVTREYLDAINAGLADAARHAERGYGEKLLEQTLNRRRPVVTSPGGLFHGPEIDNLNMRDLVGERLGITQSLAAAQARLDAATRHGPTVGRGGVNSVVANAQGDVDHLKHQLDAINAALAPVIQATPKLFAGFNQAENLRGLRDLREALEGFHFSGDAAKDVKALQTQFRVSADQAKAILAAWKHLPGAIKDAENSVARFTTRNLRAGADRSIGAINKDISTATGDMKAHGVTPGTAEFTKEQQALARAAVTNLKYLLAQGVISAGQYSVELKKILRETTLSTGQALDVGGKGATKGIDSMVRDWSNGFAKVGHITDSKVNAIGDSLDKMPKRTRFAAAQSMVIMAQQLADKGKLPQQDVDHLVKLLGDRFDDLRKAGLKPSRSLQVLHDNMLLLLPPAAQVWTAIGQVGDAFKSMLPKSVFDTIGSMVSALGGLQSAVSTVSPSLGAIVGLGQQLLTPSAPKHHKHKRVGGLAFAGGGLVPIAAAGDELAVFPDGRAMRIPGDPRSDSTYMAVPPGTAIYTDHGQELLAAGASMTDALARQMPHFQGGGIVHEARKRCPDGFHRDPVTGKCVPAGTEHKAPSHHHGSSAGRVVGASYYASGVGGSGTHGYKGDYLPGKLAYAELGMGHALGGLPYRHQLDISFHGRTARGIKLDIGRGGPPVQGHTRAIDLYKPLSDKLGFTSSGVGLVKIAGAGQGGKQTVTGQETTHTAIALANLSAAAARRALPGLRRPLLGDGFETGYQAGLTGAAGWGVQTNRDALYTAMAIPTRSVTRGSISAPGKIPSGVSASDLKLHGVPRRVIAAFLTAKAIADRHPPYIYGGGHGGFSNRLRGYDCSGYVSQPLHAGGWLSTPQATDGLKSWGHPGDGKWITVGVRGSSGRSAHTMIRIGNTYWESGGRGGGGGPHSDRGWDGVFPIHRHPPGYQRGGMVGARRLGIGLKTLRTTPPAQLPRELFNPASPAFVGWGYQAGGVVGTADGAPHVRGPGHVQPHSESLAYATGYFVHIEHQLERAGSLNERAAKDALNHLISAIGDVSNISIKRLEGLEHGIRGEISHLARGGLTTRERAQVRRLRAALTAIETEIGGRVGRAVGYLQQQHDALEATRTLVVDQRLRLEGADPSSSHGQQVTENFDRFARDQLRHQQKGLEKQLDVAERHGDTAAIKDITDRIKAIGGEIQETTVQIIEAHRNAIRAAAQEQVDQAAHGVATAQGMAGGLDAYQRLQDPGYADTPEAMRQRASLAGTIADAERGHLSALNAQLGAAQSTGADPVTINGILEAIQASQTQIMNSMADSADLIRQAAEKTSQIAVDAAQFRGDADQVGYQGLQLDQQLRGTAADNMPDAQARADYITQKLIPDLQQQHAALKQNYDTIAQQEGAGSDAAHQAWLAWAQKDNEIKQDQLDAQKAIQDATEAAAQRLSDFKGSTGYEYGGAAWTDLIATGSGV